MEGLIPPPLHAVRIRLLEKGGGNLRDGLLRRGCITHTHTHTHTSEFALFPSLFLSKQERGGRGGKVSRCMPALDVDDERGGGGGGDLP